MPVDYDRLAGMLGAGSYEQLKCSHKGWIEEYLGDGRKGREGEWTSSIAVGNRPFVEKVKARVLGSQKREYRASYFGNYPLKIQAHSLVRQGNISTPASPSI